MPEDGTFACPGQDTPLSQDLDQGQVGPGFRSRRARSFSASAIRSSPRSRRRWPKSRDTLRHLRSWPPRSHCARLPFLDFRQSRAASCAHFCTLTPARWTLAPGDDGRKTASVDVLGMVFDQAGAEVACLSTGFAVALTDRGRRARRFRDGLAYNLRIPIRRTGRLSGAIRCPRSAVRAPRDRPASSLR